MRILYITTIGGTMGFFKSIIKQLVDEGHAVDIACQAYHVPDEYSEMGCRLYPLSCSRIPWDRGNFKAIKEIRNIVSEGNYEIVHCHTPIAAMCTRIACKALRNRGVKVIYTAHGFHFFKGAPLINWLIYYPIEWICSWWTDMLITINREDYQRAQKCFHAIRTEYVPGVGVDISRFQSVKVERKKKREELGVVEDAYLIISIGEMNQNKNHQLVLNAIGNLKRDDIFYLIIGQDGEQRKTLEGLVEKYNLLERVKFLGYRSDVLEIYKCADLFILPSYREGLSVSTMEALASGVNVAISDIRGNKDLVSKDFLFNPYDQKSVEEIILREYFRKETSTKNRLSNEFSLESVNKRMIQLYKEVL